MVFDGAFRPPRVSDELRARVLVSVIALPVGVAAVWVGGWYLAVLAAAIAALAAREFYGLVAAKAGLPLGWMGIPAAGLIVFLAADQQSVGAWAFRALLVLFALGLATSVFAAFRRARGRWLVSAMLAVAGVVYTGGALSFGLFLRYLPVVRGAEPEQPLGGFLLVMLPVAVTCSADVASYFVGRRLGRTRLAPRVSPGKTVEGSIGGLVAATLTGYLLGLYLDDIGTLVLSAPICALMGLALGIVSQVGDLSQSLLKREAGVKDSGKLLPGHGGVLDRFDSHLFTLPVAYGLVFLAQLLV